MPDKSDKHGPKLDEEIGRETQGMVSGGHPTHAEEFKETEPFSDDYPADPAGATAGDREGSPPGMSARDVEGRSALARMLSGVRYPARPNELVRHAAEGGAPDGALDQLRTLPKREYENVADVAEELGYGREERRY
ncbi:hypothetical protein BKA00_001275 [Actinomadura coerulea]|uniref:DUF2795 domain-containing protein n=1 Tax=Actinomadura coerulea TaxID=46159 RepID=A0A7X0FWW4_9ACTN|nr:DUF2795 domain-containing protein [Actinomadura coerulea]MBB6394361.1 hypothetical protein [Actinomadura coerulea]GGQ41049.1 hypothetical protein GCM10010187_69090 [Actinomadura coerulea]